ncbi:2-oxoglutarate dehydrogenase E1 component [bacterium]|nr:2-oxoglutarate dehydrogenase E1 component [bacterium]
MAEPDGNIDSANLAYIEQLYRQYLADRDSVPAAWAQYFGQSAVNDAAGPGPSFRPASIFHARPIVSVATSDNSAILQDWLDQLVRAYRINGHLAAAIDPLELRRHELPELDPASHGLGPEFNDHVFSSRSIAGPDQATLRELHSRLKNTYCRSIGAQFMHINDTRARLWLQDRMESAENRLKLNRAEQLTILTKLTDAVIFEEFMQKKYIGAKRFSLEGAESLVPLLQLALDRAAHYEINGVVIGMPHRGRLNVLANIIGKSAKEIFQDFEGINPEFEDHHGDVKYHQGYGTTWTGPNGHKLHVSLCFNPSHLEYVNPVALGRARANIDRYADPAAPKGMCILVHGEAAFAGQGIIQEILNFSRLPGYTTGGTLHVIVNNQIGFTTDPEQSRSTEYATDVAKMLEIPIFHVNGEDPEAVAQVVALALDFRQEFHQDSVIDMYCYRRRGHNEGDEPAFTQPLVYEIIKGKPPVREVYRDHLVAMGGISREQADRLAVDRREELERLLAAARSEEPVRPHGNLGELWSSYHGGPQDAVVEVSTGVGRARLVELLNKLSELPAGFTPHPKIARWLEQRSEMAQGELPLDWSAAEALALASIATEGLRVRLSGQDSERGTFSHRHSVLHDVTDNRRYCPLEHLAPDQAPVRIVNSPLSESSVLGFEYGYSLDCPDALVCWEAQFGDFCNCAQVIIDQFIVSAEDKWGYFSGLVLLLPHGYEGMGPEHSSARLERFLQLAAEDNIQVVQPTTPAQYFHCLRRQVISRWRKPLIVLTPKSLLRNPAVQSSLDDCAMGRFRRVLYDPLAPEPAGVKRVLLTSGKVYYDLDRVRREEEYSEVAIIRLEQLYPLARQSLLKTLAQYGAATPVYWVQDEPENMGAWRYLQREFCPAGLNGHALTCISRPAAASPATGGGKQHQREQEELLARAYAGLRG